jgi:DNA-binding response OmpR family regulator
LRRPRVILYDSERVVLETLRDYFEHRDFDVLCFAEPSICPVYSKGEVCTKSHLCSDLMIAGHTTPRMSGVDLLHAQANRGCKLAPLNKAVTGHFLDNESLGALRRLGASFFHRPFDYDEFGRWVDGCVANIDLSRPLAIRRKEKRTVCTQEIRFQIGALSEMRTGTVVNVSRQGLCLEVQDLLQKDRSLTLHTSLPLAASSALVRWTRQVADGMYHIGLQCY